MIEGYRLLFKGSRTGSYLTIEPQEARSVPVAAWATEEDEAALDRYEGFPTFITKRRWSCPSKGFKDRKGASGCGRFSSTSCMRDRPLGAAERVLYGDLQAGIPGASDSTRHFWNRRMPTAGRNFGRVENRGDACFIVTNRKNGCTRQLHTVLGIRWEIFLAPEQQGQPLPRIRRSGCSAAGRRRSGIGRKGQEAGEWMRKQIILRGFPVCPKVRR